MERRVVEQGAVGMVMKVVELWGRELSCIAGEGMESSVVERGQQTDVLSGD